LPPDVGKWASKKAPAAFDAKDFSSRDSQNQKDNHGKNDIHAAILFFYLSNPADLLKRINSAAGISIGL
jgi:hypothetical protein